jgi:DNA-binding MarR family transcriptional regulator
MLRIHIISAARNPRRMATLRAMPKSFDFRHAPGHLIRRAHQLAVAIFMEETADYGVTPVQFAILNALMEDPGEDQVTLAGKVAFDAATFGSVIGRLEAKGWVRRKPDAQDKRRKLLWVTPEGERAAMSMKRAVAKAQARILGPLEGAERDQLLKLLGKLVARHAGD